MHKSGLTLHAIAGQEPLEPAGKQTPHPKMGPT